MKRQPDGNLKLTFRKYLVVKFRKISWYFRRQKRLLLRALLCLYFSLRKTFASIFGVHQHCKVANAITCVLHCLQPKSLKIK